MSTPTPAIDPSVLAGSAAPAPDLSSQPQAPSPLSGAPDLSSQPQMPQNPNAGTPSQEQDMDTQMPAMAKDNTPTPPPTAGVQSVWKSLVMGALHGLAGSAGQKHFGGGLAAGAAGEQQAQQQATENAQKQQQLNSDVQFKSVQAANMTLDNSIKAQQLASMPEDIQRAHEKEDMESLTAFKAAFPDANITVLPNNHGGAEITSHMKDLTKNDGGVPPATVWHLPGDQIAYVDTSKVAQQPQALSVVNDIRKIEGFSDRTTADWQNPKMEAQRIQDTNDAATFWAPHPTEENLTNYKQYLINAQSDTASPEQKAAATKLQGVVDRLQKGVDSSVKDATDKAIAAKNAITSGTAATEAAAAGQKAGAEEQAKQNVKTTTNTADNWVPKATADEKKKAELAENIGENSVAINSILARRPDIVGAVAGRYTNAQQMIGNNDPDISALGTRIHNIAMASNGVHGMRSQQSVEENEKNIINGFKNGPKSVAGALKATTDSVQTFIDNARPDTYGTNSKNGGAVGYYTQRQPGDAQGAAGKVHKNMADFKQATPTKEHGTLYTDDGHTWYTHDGSVYKGQ